MPAALPPEFAPINEHEPAHGMVFAKAYSVFLNYYDVGNNSAGDWQDFFGKDVSVRLAVAAIDDIDGYREFIKACTDFLNDRDHQNQTDELKNRLGLLFGCLGSLALQLDRMKEGMPSDLPLQGMLKNRIRTSLAGVYQRFLSYYKAALNQALVNDPQPALNILGEPALSADGAYNTRLSEDWIVGEFSDWFDYVAAVSADATVFGDLSDTEFAQINRIATHNLFTGIFDEFLKVYARLVVDAGEALAQTFTDRDDHEPHYALFLSFLRLFEHTRGELNELTGKHLDFYYQEILKLGKKPAAPPKVHLLLELAKQVDSHLLPQGTTFKAGKDDAGGDAFFASQRSLVANQAKVSALKTVYRHDDEKLVGTVPDNLHQGRIFASPEAASADGNGAKLSADDPSWHPFFNKRYQNGLLEQIDMPEAEIGFAIASHYLWLAEGTRTVTTKFSPIGTFPGATAEFKDDIVCLLSGEKGWFETPAVQFSKTAAALTLKIALDGAEPAVVPYSAKVHGYAFATGLPMLLIKLRHRDDALYIYEQLQNLTVASVELTVEVHGLRTLAVSNDFGPVDTSKPFQPFGASPQANSSMIVGSKEAFQKRLTSAVIHLPWKNPPAPFETTVNILVDYLKSGSWTRSATVPKDIGEISFPLASDTNGTVVDQADFSKQEFYATTARHGFVRLVTSEGFGQAQYEQALIDYIRQQMANDAELTRHVADIAQTMEILNRHVENVEAVENIVNQQFDTLQTSVEDIAKDITDRWEDAAPVIQDFLSQIRESLLSFIKMAEALNNVATQTLGGSTDGIFNDNSFQEIIEFLEEMDIPTGNVVEVAASIIERLQLATNNISLKLREALAELRTLLANADNVLNQFCLAINLQAFSQLSFNLLLTGLQQLQTALEALREVLQKPEQLVNAGFEQIRMGIEQITDVPQLILDLFVDLPNTIDAINKIITGEPQKPVAPSGPFASEITLDYTSQAQVIRLDSTNPDAFDNRPSTFFHLAPFGQAEQHPLLNTDHQVKLIPPFLWQQSGNVLSSEAEFYIGITGLQPPQTLAMLFQVADGTADPLTVKPDPHIQWSYLSANEWIAFTTDEVTDETGGLINSGIIEFAVPDDATDDNTLLPPDTHWLRAAVATDSEAVCRLLKVAAQALPAEFDDRNNDPGFAAKTLPAGTITKTERADASLKKIEQPFPSFGGRGAEAAPDYYRRVSERLRHKDRAVSLWDYERLVLEAFPQLYRVKCLNHTQYEPSADGIGVYRELAPGHVTVVTIPDMQFQTLRDPLKPYTSLGLLKDIEDFLESRKPCFVTLHVRNPRFEAVRCAFKVRLFDGYDISYYLGILQQTITQFLSPWAFSNDVKPSFGGKIYKSVLIDLVEAQPYIDYVTDFRLFHDVEGANTGSVDLNEVKATTAVSILVSAPSGDHDIEELKPADSGQSGETTCPCEL